MTRAEQGVLQQYLRDLRERREITPLCRDVGEAMIWHCRKRADGCFQVGFPQLAGLAKGCCRDTAIEAVRRLREIGFVVREKTRVWCAALHKWVTGKNVYRLTLPVVSESEIPAGSPSKDFSFLLEKEVAHEREAEEPCRTPGKPDADRPPEISESHCVAGIPAGGEEGMGDVAQPISSDDGRTSPGTTRSGGEPNGATGRFVEGAPRLMLGSDPLAARRAVMEERLLRSRVI
jgi:hypothetical protein